MSLYPTLMTLIAPQALVLLKGPNGYSPTVAQGQTVTIIQSTPRGMG